MGNCQVTDAAAVVIQHPDGRVERLYWPTSAGEVMRSHPGHYVTRVTFYISRGSSETSNTASLPAAAGEAVRITRVRLLRHKDILLVGQVYRLVTSQEVTKAINARKQERMRKDQAEQMKQQEEQQKQERRRLQHSRNGEEGVAQTKLCMNLLLLVFVDVDSQSPSHNLLWRRMRRRGKEVLGIGGLRCRASQRLEADVWF